VSTFRVLVTGSRAWADAARVWNVLESVYSEEVASFRYESLLLIHGACPTGADAQADAWALWSIARGRPVGRWPFAADWNRGPQGGPERNLRMVQESRPDFALAFPQAMGKRGGTRDCMAHLFAHGVPTLVLSG